MFSLSNFLLFAVQDTAQFGQTVISTQGAVIGLFLAIFLIFRKVHPVYSLMFGALVGGLIGHAGLSGSVEYMIKGAGAIMPAILRILSAGVLAGILIRSGAATKIASDLVQIGGNTMAIPALALTTLILTAAGVFIDIAVITAAPVALAVGYRTGISRTAILTALIGGGKAGNIMSPNPNTIAISENMKIPLTDLMTAGILPALGALLITCLIAFWLRKKNDKIGPESIPEEKNNGENQIGFFPAIIGPAAAIGLLVLRPLFGIKIDPLVALPAGGLIGLLFMRKGKFFNEFAAFGLGKMTPVVLLLIGTGCLAGIITGSDLKDSLIRLINHLGLPAFALAPLAGILLGGATASTTAGSAVASSGFGAAITELGFSPLQGGVMIHTGATVIDSLPHGSFFHATGGAVQMSFRNRLKIIPCEMAVGLTQTVIAVLIYGMLKLF